MSDETLAEQARGLRTDVGDLAKSVTALAGRTAQSERTVSRMRRITTGLIVATTGLVLSLVLIVGLAAYSVALNRRLNGFVRCQADYNAAYDAALLQRTRALTDATADERAAERARTDAFDTLFTDPAVNRPPGETTPEDRETIQRLYARYLKAAKDLKAQRAAADAARAANPVPVPSEIRCKL